MIFQLKCISKYCMKLVYSWSKNMVNASKHAVKEAFLTFSNKQEWIPVGCVPPAAVAISRGVSTPRPPVQTPPGAGTLPLGAGTPREQAPPHEQTPPGSRHPCEQNHRRLWKYNLAPTSLRAVTMVTLSCTNTSPVNCNPLNVPWRIISSNYWDIIPLEICCRSQKVIVPRFC